MADGLVHLPYKTRLAMQTNASSHSAIDPKSVLDAPCTVVEPNPPQTHYPLAVAFSTFATRRWLAGLAVEHWLHRYPRLIVSDWDDDDDTGLIGMRWGVSYTFRGLAPVLCLADAMCGRFDWLLFCDDDTAVDSAALHALVHGRLTAANPSRPHFISFAPQPFPSRLEWTPSLHGCLGAQTRHDCRRPQCREPPDLRQPCVGEPVAFSDPRPNLGAMWAYGGLGMLLSRGAAAALHTGRLNETEGGNPWRRCQHRRIMQVMDVRAARLMRMRSEMEARAAADGEEKLVERALRGGAATGGLRGRMRGDGNPHTLRCLREMTCPWGQYQPCDRLPTPFNHSSTLASAMFRHATTSELTAAATAALEKLAVAAGPAPPPLPPCKSRGCKRSRAEKLLLRASAAERRSGFCAPYTTEANSKDCRLCGGTDVQVSCCLASLGIFLTDLSTLDWRIRPSGMGNAYWSPWAASLKGHRNHRTSPEQAAAALRTVTKCGLSAGPGWDLHVDKGAAPKCAEPDPKDARKHTFSAVFGDPQLATA